MHMSKRSVEILLDLVEIKLSLMQINDKEDAKEYKNMQECRRQLLEMLHSAKKNGGTEVFEITDGIQKLGEALR